MAAFGSETCPFELQRGLRPAPTKHHLFRETLGRVDGIAEGVVNEPELRGFHMSLYFHLG